MVLNDSPGTTTHQIKCAQHQEGTQEISASYLLWDIPELRIFFFSSIKTRVIWALLLKKKNLRKDMNSGDGLLLRSKVIGVYFKLSGQFPSLTLLDKNGSCGDRSSPVIYGWFLSGLDPKLTFACSSKACVSHLSHKVWLLPRVTACLGLSFLLLLAWDLWGVFWL